MDFRYRDQTFSINSLSESDHIYKHIVESNSFYEIDLLEYIYSLRSFLPRGKAIAIDVGANIGNHSIFLGKFLSDYVFAIEPYEPTFQVLQDNLRRNLSGDQYFTFCLAVGESDGTGVMKLPDDGDSNFGMMKFEASSEGGRTRLVTLENLVDEACTKELLNANVAIVKIDVEGMEMSVLRGGRKILEKFKPHLFIELSTDSAFESASQFLDELGYKVMSCHADTPVYHFAYKPNQLLYLFIKYLSAKLYFDKHLKPRIIQKLHTVFS
ncbi:FkbM family methyltransferase [Nodosilinea sp. LEGE 06152]|uniref:FkbM family methyltransferase n=1 Tax=Nodosilinea sp. LEGE 06152 TaxID=2777966 RepID=UPI00187F516F|nr:FkbM family methyltransferase [Nodosilinea sp. LEGE 06152]MBE9157912.1 FkbM family methyltransferase [Nodosilinea sp. LEGE 06152]